MGVFFDTKIRCATKINKNISTSIWWLCWTVVHHTSVGLLSLTHASMDSDNHPITFCLLSSQSPPKDYNVLRTFHSPSESISPMGFRFCFVVLAQLSNPLRVLSKTQPRLDDEYTCGRLNRLTAHYFGYWSLAMGYRLWAGVCGVPLSVPFASNLSPHRLIAHHLYALFSLPTKGSVLTQMPQADAWAIRVSRVKTDGLFGRTS